MKTQNAALLLLLLVGCGIEPPPPAPAPDDRGEIDSGLTLSAPSASNDETTVTFQMQYSTTGKFNRAYLDTDQQPTGFAVGGLGADYLLENSRVYVHTGTGWSWALVGTSTFSASSGIAKWQLPRALIKQTATCGDKVGVGFNVDSSAVLKLSYTYSCPNTAPPLKTLAFTGSSAKLLNPERGFYTSIDLTGSSAFTSVRGGGYTIALAQVRLDAYRTTALPASLLTTINAGLARVRAAGFKVILRFKYNDGFQADASKAQMLAHIAQLKPIFTANEDVISVVQAGLIGAWGEWHDSTNGLDNTADRSAILTALLAAVPASRMVQVRTPDQIAAIFPGGALTAAHAFDGSNVARVGHHNDCFLASESDFGTYSSPIATWKAYVAQIGQFTPIGGETCNPAPPRSSCASATAEMRQLHYSYMNAGYHATVLNGWSSGGCMDAVVNELGYRLRAVELTYSDQVKPGGVLQVQLKIANDGYASLYNARPVKVVLSDGAHRYVATLAAPDPRKWASGATTTVSTSLRVPSAAAPGQYKLSLWLPDANAALESRPEFAISLANSGLTVDSTGATALGPVTVDASVGGPSVTNAPAFVEL